MAALAVEGMSLDRFMAKHTSEDNASFQQIMEESNKRRRLNKPWLFEQQDKVSAHSTHAPIHQSIALPGSLHRYWVQPAEGCASHFAPSVTHAVLPA